MPTLEIPIKISEQHQQPPSNVGYAERGGEQLRTTVTFEALEALPAPALVPGEIHLGTLFDPRLRIVGPIHVRLFEDRGQVVAEATAFNEFGFGSNASEAVEDVQRALVQLYFSLEETKDRLGSDLQVTWLALQKSVTKLTAPA